MKIKFVIETNNLRKPKMALDLIEDYILMVCGECIVEKEILRTPKEENDLKGRNV